MEYMSILNGIKNNLSSASRDDYFIVITGDTKSLLNSFDFYLLRPKDNSAYSGITSSNYIRSFDIIANPSDFDIFNAGFSRNVYGDQKYSFVINADIDNNGYYERNNMPITDLYIYANYKPNVGETMLGLHWDNNGIPSTGTTSVFGCTDYCSMIMTGSTSSAYTQTIIYSQINYIDTPYITTGGTEYFSWKYAPMIPVKINLLSDELFKLGSNLQMLTGTITGITGLTGYEFNPIQPIELGVISGSTSNVYSGSTSYDLINSIPEYAYNLGDGRFIWRNILPQGYINPITSVTLSNPFMNGYRYVFSSIIVDMGVNKEVLNTANAFSNIYFNFTSINNKPVSDLNDIGKPCK
jgi:hypothetical protein